MSESTAARRASKQVGQDAIRPFHVNFAESDLIELRYPCSGLALLSFLSTARD
jgi:hypothetical protein